MHKRLSPTGATILKDLFFRAGQCGHVTLSPRLRPHTVALWRGGYIEVWHRATSIDDPRFSGPFYSLTLTGFQVAAAIIAATGKPDFASRSRPARYRPRSFKRPSATKGNTNVRLPQQS